MERDIEFGKRLLELRKKKNLTQKELGLIGGVTRQTIRNYELGLTKPKEKVASKLASALGVDINYFYNGTIEHVSLNKLTYKDLLISYMTFNESCLFEEKEYIDENNNNVFAITTTDPDFINFVNQLRNILSVVGSLSADTLNTAIKELLDSFEISVLAKYRDR